jgi:hypothetical protein
MTLSTLYKGVLANEPMLRCLFWLLKEDAKRRPEINSHAKHHLLPDLVDGEVVDGVDALGVALARGDKLTLYLRNAASLVLPTSEDTPLHIRGFRSMFSGHSTLILKTWRVLLPGLAQLWFRLKFMFTQFPFRLLLLIDDNTSSTDKDRIALELLTAPQCCLDSGFSAQLVAIAQRIAPHDRVAQQRFIRGSWTFAVLTNFNLSVQGTIIDLECTNAHVRNFQLNGRPPSFSTTSAKCFIHEAECLFKARWHRNPQDHLHDAIRSFQSVSGQLIDGEALRYHFLLFPPTTPNTSDVEVNASPQIPI